MAAYYNEHDAYAAQWLRNLITAGHIAPGEVDERDIQDVRPSELAGFTQCHFFAGIGVWSLALRRAGWPDDRPVWTGSCPCQPFSAAGKGLAFDDERHLWPAWHHLISQRKPAQIFGEQVASRDGYAWLDLVQTDMEGTGYAFGPVVLPVAGFGAPHGRHRIFFVAHAMQPGRPEGWAGARGGQITGSGGVSALADTDEQQRNGCGGIGEKRRLEFAERGESGAVVLANSAGRRPGQSAATTTRHGNTAITASPNATNGFWARADWLRCLDGKARPVEPGTFPLAHGIASRMDKLRAYGNAISPQVATEFIKAYLGSI